MRQLYRIFIPFCFLCGILFCTLPALAQTPSPMFLGLPFFMQSAFFIDATYQISMLFKNDSATIWGEIIFSTLAGIGLISLIIAIEYRSLRKALSLEKSKKLLNAISQGNIIVAIVSIPVSFIFLTQSVIEFQTFGPIALFPLTDSFWVLIGVYTPLAFALGLSVMYFIKKHFILEVIQNKEIDTVKKAIWYANLKSYAYPILTMLLLIIIVPITISFLMHYSF